MMLIIISFRPPRNWRDTRRQIKFIAFEIDADVDIVMRPDGSGLHGLLSLS